MRLVVAMVVVCFAEPASAQELSEGDVARHVRELDAADATTRAAAAEALGRGAGAHREAVLPGLRRLLGGDPDWHVRASSGRALGRLGTRDAVPDLVRALRDESADVRVVAAAALWRLPDPAAVPALLTTLDDADPSVREWSALALGVVRDRRARAPLVAHLHDATPAVRLAAVRALGRIGDAAALGALVTLARDAHASLEERTEAVDAITLLGGGDAVNALGQLAADPERRVRARAIAGLSQVGDALVVPVLRRRAQVDPVPALRTAAREAAGAVERRLRERDAGAEPPATR